MSSNFGLYSQYAEKVEPQVRAALEGRRRIPQQTPLAEAWLALALFLGESSLRLEHIIHIADGISHAFPNSDEIAWALLRIRDRGWLVESNGEYGLTSEGRSAIARVIGEGEVLERLDRLMGWVSMNPPHGRVEC